MSKVLVPLAKGFEEIEVTTTPGKLDIDIMVNNKEKIQDKFWKTFIDYSDEQEKDNMQEFIAKSNLSSHMMVECQKV